MRVGLWAFGICLFATNLAFAQFAPPRPGPIGWETRIAPGFDPPIEYVLIYESPELGRGPKLDEVVKGWGPKAGAVLIKLYRDPAWAEYQYQVLNLIGKVDAPEVTALLKEEANKILTEAPPSKRPDYTQVRLLNMLAERDPATADSVAYQVVEDPTAPYFESMVGYLILRAGQDNGKKCRARLESIAANTSDDRLRRRIHDALSGYEAQWRAQEPMQTVLDREAKEEKR